MKINHGCSDWACSFHLSPNEEEEFLKKLHLTLMPFKLFDFLVICILLVVGISLNK